MEGNGQSQNMQGGPHTEGPPAVGSKGPTEMEKVCSTACVVCRARSRQGESSACGLG